MSGDTVVVGAFGEESSAPGVNGNQGDNAAPLSGAAYVFVRSGTTWSQQAYLKASAPGGGDRFGHSVAVSNDTVVVGAWLEASNATGVNGDQGDNSATEAGAAYVFVRSGMTWSQQAYLKASNTGASDRFGISVAVSGDTAVVGAYWEDSNATGVNGDQADNSASHSGAAYVFVRSGGVWSQQAYLKASNTGASDDFGYSVAVSGDTVVVGAILEDSSASGVDGNQADDSAADSGAAYVFVRSGSTWSQQAYLKASNTGADDGFGDSVGVSGDTVVVGAYQERSNATGVNGNQGDNSATEAGAAYVFVFDGDGDGIADGADNCPTTANTDQADANSDGVGDVCDLCNGDDASGDTDGDGVCDSDDECPDDPNKTAAGDCGCGVADVDADADGIPDCNDNCPNDENADQADANADGIGDACEQTAGQACCGGGLPALLPLLLVCRRLRRRRLPDGGLAYGAHAPRMAAPAENPHDENMVGS